LPDAVEGLDLRDLYYAAYSDFEEKYADTTAGKKVNNMMVEHIRNRGLTESGQVVAEITKDLYVSDALADRQLMSKNFNEVAGIFSKLLEHASADEVPVLVESFEQNIGNDRLDDWVQNRNNIPLLRRLVDYGSEVITEKIRSEITSALESTVELDTGVLRSLKNSFADVIKLKTSAQLPELFDVPASITESWDMDVNKFLKNIETMQKVEQAGEGYVKLLHDNYGIHEFDRYPAEMLAEQAREHGEEGDYGVVMFPRHEFDGEQAFDREQETFAELFEATEGEITPRIFEIDSTTDMMRRFGELRQQYDDEIRYFILGGHGTPEDIEFGGHNNRGTDKLDIDNVENSNSLKAIKDMMAEDVQAALISCSTGAEGGIRDQLEERLNIDIDAPVTKTMFNTMHAEMRDDELDMTVEFQCNEKQKTGKEFATDASSSSGALQ
jgi:hypothetical protein